MVECSVIIPVYNSEKTICQTLSSIYSAEQKLQIEVIAIDDGSTDQSVEMAQKYQDFPFFRLIQKQNGGVSSARNQGIQNAQGKYLFFADADDILHRGELEKIICYANEWEADVVIANHRVHNTITEETVLVDNKFENLGSQDQNIKLILERFFKGESSGLSVVWNKLYSKKYLQSHDLWFNEKMFHGEDWEFNIHVFENSPRLFKCNNVVYTYQIDGTQNYNKYRKNLGYSFANGYDIICAINNHFLHFPKRSMEFTMATVRFFEQICSYLDIEDVPKQEKRAFSKTKSVKKAIRGIIGIKSKNLADFNLSRKDKLRALQILFGII